MGRAPANSDFAALRVLGGLFPPEFLGGVAALDQPFQQAGDYGLATSLRDELARCWRVAGDLYAAWTERREREPEASAQLWASALLRESLGFSDLEASAPLRLGERSFPITHQALGGSLPLLLWGGASLDRPDPRFGEEGRRRSPQLLMQELLGAGTGCSITGACAALGSGAEAAAGAAACGAGGTMPLAVVGAPLWKR